MANSSRNRDVVEEPVGGPIVGKLVVVTVVSGSAFLKAIRTSRTERAMRSDVGGG